MINKSEALTSTELSNSNKGSKFGSIAEVEAEKKRLADKTVRGEQEEEWMPKTWDAGEAPKSPSFVTIGRKSFETGKSPEIDSELKMLARIAKEEKGHKQWLKQGLNLFLIISLMFMNLCLGSS